MSQLALQLIEKEKKEKTGYLELGCCGLTPDNPQLQEVWDALGELVHLETLILSNWWKKREELGYEETQNEGTKNLLDNIPKALSNLTYLNTLIMIGDNDEPATNWRIQHIENLPPSLTSFDISLNQVQKIENLPDHLTYFNISHNQIKCIEDLPKHLDKLEIRGNKIRQIEDLPAVLHELDISTNRIREIENLPSFLEKLDLGFNQIRKIKNLPQNIKELDLSGNQIQNIEGLPQKLYKLNIRGNQIQRIENLPSSLLMLEISNNQIHKIENLPSAIDTVFINENQIETIENLPETLCRLFINRNQLKDLSSLIPYLNGQKNNLIMVSNERFEDLIGKRFITMYNNPIKTPPEDIVRQGNEAILHYFEKIENTENSALKMKANIKELEVKPPTVFISYSWDNEKHKKWVQTLAEDLIRKSSIDVILDIYELRPGKNLHYFMERSVEKADKVLLILTENYKQKADNRKGGVGYESSMISAEMYGNQLNNDKFIPILRYGDVGSSIPNFIKPFIWLDMSSDEKYENNLETLTREIYDKPKIKKPPLGKTPDYIKDDQ